ncbi:MAG: hypothetical protein ACI9XR_000626 [Flavobacterium sp.]|jgi:hypothetical protein
MYLYKGLQNTHKKILNQILIKDFVFDNKIN